MLNLYRRHVPGCKKKGISPERSKCSCPIWCDGQVNGERCRKSLKTSNWQRAVHLAERLERPNETESRLSKLESTIGALLSRVAGLESMLEAKNCGPTDPARVQDAMMLMSATSTEQGEIYFVRDDRGRIKIGFATRTESSIAALQIANGSKLTVMLFTKGNRDTEPASIRFLRQSTFAASGSTPVIRCWNFSEVRKMRHRQACPPDRRSS